MKIKPTNIFYTAVMSVFLCIGTSTSNAENYQVRDLNDIVLAPGVAPELVIPGIPLPSLKITSSESMVTVGDNFSVIVSVFDMLDEGAGSLGGYDLNVFFDPNLLSYGDITWGNQLDLLGLGSFQFADDSNAGLGSINVYELSLDDVDSLQLDDFVLFTLTFSALDAGTTNISLGVNALSDALGNDIYYRDIDPLTVQAVPLPAALPLFASALALGFGLARRRG